jgi:hypothetical protein
MTELGYFLICVAAICAVQSALCLMLREPVKVPIAAIRHRK